MIESFAQMFEESLASQRIRPGQILTGRVIEIGPDKVVVSAGLKSEAVIDIQQFRNDRGEIEVNVGDESSKSGVPFETFPKLLEKARNSKNLRVRGLMAIPPFLDDPEAVRPYFVKLRQLRDGFGGATELPELSMGMSHDFGVAIEEGATLVRVGTAIFGSR